ncbi:hypothetical protein LCGC14_0757400 [marine sediment metagenome]|uniref:YlxR domain-containing protein n=1 Tax=marine sediment metagenome TaxID=412755 RepID=A0A0F9T968_9ZZZZ
MVEWACHICGDKRPDTMISVYTSIKRIGESPHTIPFTQNVRYCNDRPSCIEGAKTKSFVD